MTRRPSTPFNRSLPAPTQYRPSYIEAAAVRFLGGEWLNQIDQLTQEYEASTSDVQRRRLYIQAHRIYHDAVTAARTRSNCPADLIVRLATHS